jgi:hypothetical protein
MRARFSMTCAFVTFIFVTSLIDFKAQAYIDVVHHQSS